MSIHNLYFPASRGLSRRGKNENSSWETSASRENLYMMLLFQVNIFLWQFEFSIWAFNFAYLNSARIYYHGSLFSWFYAIEKKTKDQIVCGSNIPILQLLIKIADEFCFKLHLLRSTQILVSKELFQKAWNLKLTLIRQVTLEIYSNHSFKT